MISYFSFLHTPGKNTWLDERILHVPRGRRSVRRTAGQTHTGGRRAASTLDCCERSYSSFFNSLSLKVFCLWKPNSTLINLGGKGKGKERLSKASSRCFTQVRYMRGQLQKIQLAPRRITVPEEQDLEPRGHPPGLSPFRKEGRLSDPIRESLSQEKETICQVD